VGQATTRGARTTRVRRAYKVRCFPL
jgi:hypothetical protein